MPISKAEFDAAETVEAKAKKVLAYLTANTDNAYTYAELKTAVNIPKGIQQIINNLKKRGLAAVKKTEKDVYVTAVTKQ